MLTLVERMPQMIWRAIGQGLWTWSSPQWTRYTGQTPADSAGTGWLDAVHPDDHDAARAAWREAPAAGVFHVDLRVRGRGGEYKWFQTRASAIRDDADPDAIIEWIGTSTDIHDLRQLQSEQKILVSELQHRTRNLIAVVHSIATQTLLSVRSLAEFGNRFDHRLAALSRVQGLLSTSEHDPITIRGLIELELNALAAGRHGEQVTIAGREVVIRNTSAQTLALAVHELCTNALKYGALSQPEGRLQVDWSEHVEDGEPWLCVEWHEAGVAIPQDATDRPSGYGRILIERALPRQLGARTAMRFGADGMTCIIDLPLKNYRLGDSHG